VYLDRSSKSSTKIIAEKEETEIMPQSMIDLSLPETEPVYCFCNNVSYGDMIKCDNDLVLINF
jgi:hypothetical protein